uniref:Uncharacterized protein n=1 Tax=Avena sativa TaxID=4498 RepID=A0ACD5U0Y1_AVESA
MARSSSVTEDEVGITCYTTSSLPGFRGVLKHRYSDFIVNEVARDGSVVRLTSFDLPAECVEAKEEDKAAPSADADHSQALESFSGLCGEADCRALKGLIEKVAAGGESDLSPLILSPDADKAHRSEVHNFFRNNFKFLVTDTVEHSDGVQKSIRVRVGSEAGGGRGGAERSILLCLRKSPDNYLQALKGIPRTLRMMYVHSYQSYLWNHAASMRVEKYGISQVIEGDLIYSKESRPEEATSVGTSEADDGHANLSEIDICSEILPEENIQSVKIVDSEDLLKGVYSFEDVVLPLPGSQALFPGNEVAEVYHEMAKKDGISLTENAHGVKEFSITNMKGGYRRVFQRPIDFEWELMTYTDDSASLAETDLDIMSKDKLTDAKVANEPASTGSSVSETSDCKLEGPLETSMPTSETSVVQNKSIGSSDTLPSKLAVKLSFTLPSSSYATMAIRELLKNSTSVAYQKTLDC